MSKVLFLDVDGVLNNYRTGGIFTVTKSKLRLLQQIVDRTGCKIILSSTWRLNVMGELDVLKKKLWYRKLTIADARQSLMVCEVNRYNHGWHTILKLQLGVS